MNVNYKNVMIGIFGLLSSFIFVSLILEIKNWYITSNKGPEIYTFELSPATSTEYCNVTLKFACDTVESILVAPKNSAEVNNFNRNAVLATSVVPSDCNHFTQGQQWFYLLHFKSAESYTVKVKLKNNPNQKFQYLGAYATEDKTTKVDLGSFLSPKDSEKISEELFGPAEVRSDSQVNELFGPKEETSEVLLNELFGPTEKTSDSLFDE